MNGFIDRVCRRRRLPGLAFCAVILFVFNAQAGAQDNGFVIPQANENAASQNAANESTPLENESLGQSGSEVSPEDSSGQMVSSRRLLEVIQNGGPLMIPIGICSFMLVVFTFERFISLRKGRVIPNPFTRKFIEQLEDKALDRDNAIALCRRDGSPMAQVFLGGIQKWGRPAVEVEQGILDAGERTSNSLRRYLRLLNGIATVTPLLGLLGTVLGMIHAFDAIANVEAGTADTKTLIATESVQALLTTAAGMSVAIPALIAYLFFSSRVDKHVMEIDAVGQKMVNLISAEAMTVRSTSTSSSKSKKKAA